MKFVIQLLPTLILGLFAAMLHGQEAAASRLTNAQRDAEIRQIHTQLVDIAARLAVLESSPRQFLPRGAGLKASVEVLAMSSHNAMAVANRALATESSKADVATLLRAPRVGGQWCGAIGDRRSHA